MNRPAPIAAVTEREMANAIRALAMDAVEQAKSGHPGMPMGMADAATVLFNRFLDTAVAHVDRREQVPAGAIIRIHRKVVFSLGDQDIDVAIGIGKPSGKRLRRHARATRQQVKTEADSGKTEQHEGLGQTIGPAPRRSGGRHIAVALAGCQQSACHLGPRKLGVIACDQAAVLIALQFVELVAIDFDVMAAGRRRGFPCPHQRQDQHDGNGRRQNGDEDPEQHGRSIL